MHNDVHAPIPDQRPIWAKIGSRTHPIDTHAIEFSEAPKDILLHGIAGENYYFRTDNPPYNHRAPGAIPELYVREGILKKLKRVNALLYPMGLELYVYDAYRPPEVQTYFHDVWVPTFLRERFPSWSDEEIASEVNNYWAKGYPSKRMIDPASPPPHATGGVLDLTLRNARTKEHLYMGSVFDEVGVVAHADYFEHEAQVRTLSLSELIAQRHRRLLYHVMKEEGFVINPNEWWHFGYGDQMSAFHSGASSACYGIMWFPGEER